MKSALLYLPGLDGTGRLLHRQASLHDRYQVLSVAYPQDAWHTYDSLAALAIRQLERAGPAVILAESFGGAVALTVALRRPDLVRRLLLINTFAHYPRVFIDVFALFGPALPMRASHPATRRLRGLFFFSRAVPVPVREEWWELTSDVPMSAFGRRFRLIAELDLRPRLREIRTPALVLAAPDDRVVAWTAGRLLARRMPNANLITPRVGHAALIHPGIDVAVLLREARFWPRGEADLTA